MGLAVPARCSVALGSEAAEAATLEATDRRQELRDCHVRICQDHHGRAFVLLV